ncbi:MAG: flagellar basal body protein, partial [Alphaproteobacteria bacterium]|nr:flagellar basal body protein [Alphaproteobacteria bacterium]
MDLFKALKISAAGMKAQGVRLRVIAENLANADSVAPEPGGEPYRRKVITFKNVLDRTFGVRKVEINKITID